MLIGKRMTKNPITVTKDMPVDKALQLMRKEKIRRFPVLDKKGNLVGMVAEKDLLYASPSAATALSIYEVAYLLSKITVGDVMASDVITAGEDVPLEEAEAKFAKTCHIKLTTAGLEESAIERLAKIVSENEGRCRLFIHCKASDTDEVVIESSIVNGLNPTSKAREQIEELAGEGSVMFSSRVEAVPATR